MLKIDSLKRSAVGLINVPRIMASFLPLSLPPIIRKIMTLNELKRDIAQAIGSLLNTRLNGYSDYQKYVPIDQLWVW
jgi:hypothetical protein